MTRVIDNDGAVWWAAEDIYMCKEELDMATRVVEFKDVKSLVGQELGVSDWHLVTQSEIQAFADATHDHQWIHLDVERAKKRVAIWRTCGARLLHTLARALSDESGVVRSWRKNGRELWVE